MGSRQGSGRAEGVRYTVSVDTENPVANPVGEMREGRNGGKLKTGGNNGGGRPTNEFRARMRELAEIGDPGDTYLLKCLKGDFGPKFHIAAREHVASHGHGRAPQSIALTGDGGGPLQADVTLRLVRATKADGDG